MSKPVQYSIRQAGAFDASVIASLAQNISLSTLVGTMSREEMETKGFLVSDYSAKDYARLLKRHPMSYVLISNAKIAGFLLGQYERELEMAKMVNVEMLARSRVPFAVIKQVAVALEQTGKGYGRALYQHFIKKAGCDVYAAVVMDPELSNKGAAAFHHRLGFDKAFELVCEDGLNRCVFHRQWGTVGIGGGQNG